MKTEQSLWQKYRSIISYVFFGVCTTLVNMAVYYICAHPGNIATVPSTIIAWITAVLFAYFTNRAWVFESKESHVSGIFREMVRFFGCRLATGVVDWACMYVFVDLLLWNDVIVKFAANILVIILNYIFSKLIVFRHEN